MMNSIPWVSLAFLLRTKSVLLSSMRNHMAPLLNSSVHQLAGLFWTTLAVGEGAGGHTQTQAEQELVFKMGSTKGLNKFWWFFSSPMSRGQIIHGRSRKLACRIKKLICNFSKISESQELAVLSFYLIPPHSQSSLGNYSEFCVKHFSFFSLKTVSIGISLWRNQDETLSSRDGKSITF